MWCDCDWRSVKKVFQKRMLSTVQYAVLTIILALNCLPFKLSGPLITCHVSVGAECRRVPE